MSKTFCIIDGHSQIFRAYFAPFRNLTSPTGEPTKAVHVFCSMLLKLLDTQQPDYLAMALDSPRSSLQRTELYPEYKANRPAPPEDLIVQVRRIEQIVSALGVPVWSGAGAEADDYLATAAAAYASDDLEVLLISRDKDLHQLLGPNVAIYDPMNDERIDAGNLAGKTGYEPRQAIEIQTLTGDGTDNIPGVKGVGAKTAVKLVQKYGSAQAVVEHADELTPKQRENVLAFADQMKTTRELVTLRRDLALPTSLEQCRWTGLKADAIRPILAELGLNRLIEQIDKRTDLDDSPASADNEKVQDRSERPSADAPSSGVSPEPSADADHPTSAKTFDYRLVDTPEALEQLVRRLKDVRRLAVDTETTDPRPVWAQLVGISLAFEPGVGYYLPVRGPMGATVLDIPLLRRTIGPILADPAVEKIGHHIKYDAIVLAEAGFELRGIGFDTFLAAMLLEPGERGKLDAVALRWLNHRCIPIEDLIGSGAKQLTMDRIPTDITADYAAEDADVTLRLADVLAPRLAGEGLGALLQTVEMPLLTVLAAMEREGIRVDPQELKRQELELAKQADVLRDRIMELAGGPFNPDSPKQLAVVLYEKLALPVLKKTKTGPSTDAGVLGELAARHELPGVVLEYRQLTKLLGTYLRALAECIHPRTSRVHASFHQGGAITGRLSSSDPNLQNIPVRSEAGRRIRSAFVARDDAHVLLSADYSQVELRILAHLSGDETLRAAFEADRDIHRIVAGEVFGVPAEEVTPEQRARAKGVNFGIIYGQTAHGLAQALRIGRTEAQDFIDRYKRRFGAIDAFLADCVRAAREQGYVETMLKRRRPIPDIAGANPARRAAAERMAINSVVQGSAADLIKLAMVNIHRRIVDEGRPSRMLVQIHDELLFETPAEALDAEREMIVREMESAMALTVPLKVDVGVGRNWMEAK